MLRRRALPVLDHETMPPGVVRPATRADCLGGERPCPWVGCRHHLFIEAITRDGIRSVVPEVDGLSETCALDVAAQGPLTLDQVGDLLLVSRERIRQLETKGLAALKGRVDPDLLDGWIAQPAEALPEDKGDFFGPEFVAAVNRAYERIVPEKDRGSQLLRGKGPSK